MLRDKNETIEQLIDKGIDYMEGKLEELSKKLSKSKIDAVKRTIDAYNDSDNPEHKNLSKKITKDVELILYNNKQLVISNK